MLEGLLPEAVAVAELFGSVAGVELFEQEAEAVAGAAEQRRREFGSVRLCARRALARLGVEPRPLVPRGSGPEWARRAPRWPEGVVGSMTHCAGYHAAAVALAESVAALGVDGEPDEPLSDDVRRLITLPEERPVLQRLGAAHPGVHWDRLLFSAKESVYKAWFPLTGRWLDFDQCAITPDPDHGTFTAALKVPGPVVGGVRLDRFDGRWRAGHGLLVTAVVIPVPTSERGG
ncbi:4'-phosphopantetheinyl transferase superfamily protein [Streptomyces naphthomycinicus]|uniref:4'-phosphopantetheinyl transferase family protein n=1 Tax=Streptomyces naphthomycinicus TaxID=2872625 RepID=UPI0021F0E121